MKYIIDTDQFEKLFETKAVAVLGIGDNLAVPEEGEKTVWTRMINVADLEELNSDYINEHFGELQDEAYQKGFEDGKAVNDKGCEGCKYANVAGTHEPCVRCSNSYGNQWTAKDDKIEVGDIIANNTEPKLKVWVTCFDEIGFCGIAITDFGTVDGGKLYSSCSPKGWHKIGHFDIASILEEMRHD